MSYKNNLVSHLLNRQIDLRKSINLSFYNQKIILSCFNSCDNLISLRRIIYDKIGSNIDFFCFSENGSLIALEIYVLKLNENFKFHKSPLVAEILAHQKVKALVFNKDTTKIISSGPANHHQQIVAVHDLHTDKNLKIIPVNGNVSFTMTNNVTSSPIHSDIFSFGCVDGTLFLNDNRNLNPVKIQEKNAEISSLQYHPLIDYLLLVACKSDHGIYLFDIRNKKPVFNYNIPYTNKFNTSCAKFNKKGDSFFLTRYLFNPVLFDVNISSPIYEFYDYGYFNIRSETNCCFAGPDDEYVVAPSSDNKVYLWDVSKISYDSSEPNGSAKTINSAKFVLKHLSYKNCVGYNYEKSILGCSGELDTIMFWSPFNFCSKSDRIKVLNHAVEKKHVIKNKVYNESNVLYQLMQTILINCKRVLPKYVLDFGFEKPVNFTAKNFITEFENDENINYIKSFINQYESCFRFEDNKLLNIAKNSLKETENKNNYVFEKNQFSSVFALVKVFRTRSFIKKSINYLEKQLKSLRNLEDEEKLNSIKEIELSLKSIVSKLDAIILEKEKFYEKTFEVMMKLLHNFHINWDKFYINVLNEPDKTYSFKRLLSFSELKNIE